LNYQTDYILHPVSVVKNTQPETRSRTTVGFFIFILSVNIT